MGLPQTNQVTFEDLSSHIHPANRDRAAFTATRAILGAYEIDFRILLSEDIRWVSARGLGNDVLEAADGVLILPSILSALPSDFSLASPIILPTASLAAPLICLAEPLIQSPSVVLQKFPSLSTSNARLVSRGVKVSALDPGDFRALDAHPAHQSLLIEDEGISIVFQRRGGKILGNALIDNDDRRAHADFPSLRATDVAYGLSAHQKHDISV